MGRAGGSIRPGIFCHMSAMVWEEPEDPMRGIFKPGIFCHMSAMTGEGPEDQVRVY